LPLSVDKLVEAIQAALELVHGGRVRNANVILCAKSLARNYGDVCLFKQLRRKLE
jgi:hypothetical protein